MFYFSELESAAGSLIFSEADLSDEINRRITEFIIGFEGFSNEAYKDGEHWTIGHGLPARGRNYISLEESQKEVEARTRSIATQIIASWGTPTNENELTALTSFVFNLGWGHYWALHWLHTHGYENAMQNRWRQLHLAAGVPLGGLIERRNAEIKLFFN